MCCYVIIWSTGVAKAELARRLCVSRRTIYHWIATGQVDRDLDEEPVRYRPRPPVPTKLDPYRGIITARLEDVPRLDGPTPVRRGARGGLSGRLHPGQSLCPAGPAAAARRTGGGFETPPGYQGQVDFGTFALPWGRRHALLIVLGYSRLLWLQFFPRQTMAVLIRGLEAAFTSFGGVPQELLFDQMRSVVTGGWAPGRGRARDECRVLALC